MKVLALASKYLGVGGAEAYTRILVSGLLAGGAEVEVLSLMEGVVSAHETPGRYLEHLAVRPTVWGHTRLLGMALRRGRRCDLVLCNHVAVLPVGMVLHKTFGIPYIGVAHGIDVWGAVGSYREVALHRAARMIAVSHFTARMLTATHGVPHDRISVVHPALDPGLVAPADEERRRSTNGPVILLTVARLSAEERYKGVDTVIQALPAVRATAGHVRYVIVGDGDDRPRLEALAQEQGVADVVIFRGRITAEELATQHQASDIFVMPSVTEHRRDGWAGEGFGIVYIEAAAFGLPVVAGNGGGAPEAVQDGVTGFVVDGRDVNAVAETLIRLAKDKALRARMGEAGRKWVRDYFTFERFQRDVDRAVTAVLGDTHR